MATPNPPKPTALNREKETTLMFADRMLRVLKGHKGAIPGNVPLTRNGDLPAKFENPDKGSIPMEETDIRRLIWDCRDVVMSQPMLLEVEAPTKVCGDTHGQYYDVLRLFNMGGWPPHSNYLFCGDYVDRGRYNVEVMCLMMALKIRYPENMQLLRGNHESAGVNLKYGFYEECKRKYSIKLWKYFTDLFNCLPITGIISNRIICMHGGISPELNSLEQIRRLMRPIEIPESGMMTDILWSDPDKGVTGWVIGGRGVGYNFGADVVSRFLEKFDMDLIVRAHQVVEDGYEFFAKRQLVTVFSAPNYQAGLDNAAGIMNVDENLVCSFQVLKPANRYQKAAWGAGREGMTPDGQPREELDLMQYNSKNQLEPVGQTARPTGT